MNSAKHLHNYLDLFISFLVFMTTFFLFYPFGYLELDYHHDGLMLKTALDLLNGQTLFRDTFTQYGALTAYIQMFFLFIFGPTLVSLKLGTILVYSLISVILYRTNRLFLNRSYSVVGIILWLSFAPFFKINWPLLPWASVYSLFFQMLSIYFFLKSISDESSWSSPCISGVSAISATFCRSPVGFLLLIGSCLGYFLKKYFLKDSYPNKYLFKQVLIYILSFLTPLAVYSIKLSSQNLLDDAYFQLIKTPGLWAKNFTSGGILRVFDSLFIGWNQGLIVLSFLLLVFFPKYKVLKIGKHLIYFYYILLLLLFTAFHIFNPNWYELTNSIAFLIPTSLLISFLVISFNGLLSKLITPNNLFYLIAVTICLSSWSQYYPVHEQRHLFWGISPLIGLFLYLIHLISKKDKKLVSLVICFILMPNILSAFSNARAKLFSEYKTISHPAVVSNVKVNLSIYTQLNNELNIIESFLRQHPDSPAIMEGVDALLLCFFTNLKNPYPIFLAWPLPEAITSEVISKRKLFINTERPAIILQHRDQLAVEQYMKEYNYTSYNKSGNYYFLRP